MSFRLSDKDREIIEKEAKEREITMTEVVVMAVRQLARERDEK
jgi:hypothetical protein